MTTGKEASYLGALVAVVNRDALLRLANLPGDGGQFDPWLGSAHVCREGPHGRV